MENANHCACATMGFNIYIYTYSSNRVPFKRMLALMKTPVLQYSTLCIVSGQVIGETLFKIIYNCEKAKILNFIW